MYEEAIPISEVEEGHIQTISGSVFGKSSSIRHKKYAGDNRTYERFDGDNSSDLVSYAVFKKYIKERSARYLRGQSYKAQESPRNGTPGVFFVRRTNTMKN